MRVVNRIRPGASNGSTFFSQHQIVRIIGYQQPPVVLWEPTLHGADRFFLVLCVASWQGKHTGNLDQSRGKRGLGVGPDEKDGIVIVAVTMSVLDGNLRLAYAAQSAEGGSPVPFALASASIPFELHRSTSRRTPEKLTPKNADQLLTKSIAVLPALDQLMIKSV